MYNTYISIRVPEVQPERALALLQRTLQRTSWDPGRSPLQIVHQPPNVTVAEVGSSTTVSIEVAGGTPPYIYEWWLSKPNAMPRAVPDCFQARCTLSALRLSDDGRSLFCHVRATGGMSSRSSSTVLIVTTPSVLGSLSSSSGRIGVFVGAIGAVAVCGCGLLVASNNRKQKDTGKYRPVRQSVEDE